MNLGQLQAYVEQHKPAVLGVAAAGVTGLALLQRRKRSGGAGATGTTKQPAGTIPAAAVVPSQQTGSTYDSSAFDVYNAMSGQLAKLSEQVQQTSDGSGSGITSAPAPVASTLLAPTYSGNYFGMGSGIGEIESDGSLFVFTQPQWQNALKQNPSAGSQLTDFGSKNVPGLKFFSTVDNVKAKSTTTP